MIIRIFEAFVIRDTPQPSSRVQSEFLHCQEIRDAHHNSEPTSTLGAFDPGLAEAKSNGTAVGPLSGVKLSRSRVAV